jgi:phospholipase/carboxylesterase
VSARPNALIVLLHGVGADAASLEPVRRRLATKLPNANVLALDAAEQFDGGASGRQWFSIRGVTDSNRPERVARAVAALDPRLDAALAEHGLTRDRLALFGFSQGAMLALASAVSPRPPAAVAAIAGRLAAPVSAAAQRPAIFIAHGDADPIMPIACAHEAYGALVGNGFAVSMILERGLGHQISPREIDAAATHFAKAFDGRSERDHYSIMGEPSRFAG